MSHPLVTADSASPDPPAPANLRWIGSMVGRLVCSFGGKDFSKVALTARPPTKCSTFS